jgi:protein-L-isoaspartate(D-aspartate) O-methyltransferase
MVEQIALHAVGVSDRTGRAVLAERVMQVLATVPRHAFVPVELQTFAYLDRPLPIGFGKTISQPFIVALMTDLLEVQPDDRVLEVGTGLGYQAAILANLAKTVYSVEIIEELAREAANRLQQQAYSNIVLKVGDGSWGWSEHAPFDKIIVTAASELIPTALLRQLKPGGKMAIPAGLEDSQQLLLVEKDQSGLAKTEEILPVRFSSLIISH